DAGRDAAGDRLAAGDRGEVEDGQRDAHGGPSVRLSRATPARLRAFPSGRRAFATLCHRTLTVRSVREQPTTMTTLAGPPLPVEFRSAGSWYTGALLGWQHGPDGGCALRVQFVVGGLRRSSWLPLAD